MTAPVKPCPNCGTSPSNGTNPIGSTFKHCESKTCTWARCRVCKTVWHPETGRSYTDA